MPTKKDPANGNVEGKSPEAPVPIRELIVIADPSARLRAVGPRVESASAFPADEINKVLTGETVALEPLFGPSERRVEAARASLWARAAEELPDLSVYYTVRADDSRLDALAEKFAATPGIVCAYVKPPAEPPIAPLSKEEKKEATVAAPGEDAPPVTPDFRSRQGYLGAAQEGVDALWAHTQSGGRGSGVGIIDIEGAWNFAHEDLTQNQGGVIGGTPSADLAWRNHGTAVVGEFGGDENGVGVLGIAPEANVRAISIFGGVGSAAAIRQAADALNPGDIILIELHRPGPRHDYESRTDQKGYIAVEWWKDDYDAIRYAVAKGVIVVEAAGNGGENFDDALYDTPGPGFPSDWKNPFNPGSPTSGAVVVGAGAPPPGTHGRDHGPDRSRLSFSNYGSRLDTQGWGREVTTTGGRRYSPGDLQNGASENIWYTDRFSGTSSASPIVVGAVASIQGILSAAGHVRMTPAQTRDVLRATGSPQQDAPGRPATQRIGNRPDIKAAVNHLVTSAVHSGIASQYWDELVAYPPGSAASLWLFVNNAWRKRDNASTADRRMVQQAFLEAGSQVRVWYQDSDIVGLVVSGA